MIKRFRVPSGPCTVLNSGVLRRVALSTISIGLVISGCSFGSVERADDANGVIGTAEQELEALSTPQSSGGVDLLPYDEGSTTTKPGEDDPTLGSIIPPEENADRGGTVTTVPAETTVTSPSNTDPQSTTQPATQPTTANTATTQTVGDERPSDSEAIELACANIEFGLLDELVGSDGSGYLSAGGELALASGASDYIELGQLVLDSVASDKGQQAAADSFLTRCEVDGFERLA